MTRDEADAKARDLAETFRLCCTDTRQTDRLLISWHDEETWALVEDDPHGHLRPPVALLTDTKTERDNAFRLAFGWEAMAVLAALYPQSETETRVKSVEPGQKD